MFVVTRETPYIRQNLCSEQHLRRNTDIGLKRSLLKLQQAIHTGYASKKNVRADFNFRRGDRKFCEICISIANKPY